MRKLITLLLALSVTLSVLTFSPAVVKASTIVLTPNTGPPGASITITGSGFTASSWGFIWFDTNGNFVRDAAEHAVVVSTDATGAIPATPFTIPTVATGIYSIRADIPVFGPVEASAPFQVVVSIALSPVSGPAGTSVTITGSGFAANTTGNIWFDSNGNSVIDAGEPATSVTTTAGGAIPVGIALTIPAVTTGIYSIRADIPSGGAVEASATFSVVVGINLSPSSGPPTTTVTITGSGFAASTTGNIWFDINGNSTMDVGEPSISVTTTTTGLIPAGSTLIIPTVAIGNYFIRADIPSGGTVEASATFTATATLTLSPTSGPPGTTVTITGTGLIASTVGIIWFDTNGNSVIDAGEPATLVTTTTGGAIPAGITLNIPNVGLGSYSIRADIPLGGLLEASATFVVTATLTLSPVSGTAGTSVIIIGSGFVSSTSGSVWFDTNGNSIIDAGEPAILVTTTALGAIPAGTTLSVPAVAVGSYFIRVDIPLGGAVEASATFTVVATLTLSPVSGPSGTTITISGAGFVVSTMGVIWFDTNNNNIRDIDETTILVNTTALGAIATGTTMIIPNVTPGSYPVRADIPIGGTIEASATFTVTVPLPTITASVSPTSIVRGGSATLTWTSTNTTSVSIAPDIGSVALSGTRSVSPTSTTTYTFTATGPGGTVTASVTLTVTEPPPTITASVSPTSIVRGGSATLTWTSTNTTSVSIAPDIGSVALSGTRTVSPTTTTTYTFTATGPGGTVTASVTLTVTEPPPTITASVLPTSIVRGGSAILSWTSTNATTVSISGIGVVPISGSTSVSSITTTTFAFTATGPGGTAETQVTLTVTEPPPRVVELKIGSTSYKVDGVAKVMDVAPYIEESRTMVPIRFLADGLGGTVDWDDKTKIVTVKFTNPAVEIKLTIGTYIAIVNGKLVIIDPSNLKVVPVIKGGRTFIPLRFLVEQLVGSTISWVPPDTIVVKLPR